jgi:hypothetical protein
MSLNPGPGNGIIAELAGFGYLCVEITAVVDGGEDREVPADGSIGSMSRMRLGIGALG